MDKLSENENLSSEAPSVARAFVVPDGAEMAENVAKPFSKNVWGRGQQLARARALYFKMVIPGVSLVTLIIFAIFSILWGALWKIPDHPLDGWIVVSTLALLWRFFYTNFCTRILMEARLVRPSSRD